MVGSPSGPAAVLRGGYDVLGPEESGPFQIETQAPQSSTSQIGFRGVR